MAYLPHTHVHTNTHHMAHVQFSSPANHHPRSPSAPLSLPYTDVSQAHSGWCLTPGLVVCVLHIRVWWWWCQVKLADFGVALKLSDSKQSDLDVVGSPYWMAPEIIEMNGTHTHSLSTHW